MHGRDNTEEYAADSGGNAMLENFSRRISAAQTLVEELTYHPKKGKYTNNTTVNKKMDAELKKRGGEWCGKRGKYATGPVIATKAERTRQYYAAKACKEGMNQTPLTKFFRSVPSSFSKQSHLTNPMHLRSDVIPPTPSLTSSVVSPIEINNDNQLSVDQGSGLKKRKWAAHIMGLPVASLENLQLESEKRRWTAQISQSDNLEEHDMGLDGEENDNDGVGDEEIEELMGDVPPAVPEPGQKSWEELQNKIYGILKAQRKKKTVSLALTELTQYQLLWSWFTLRMKGYKRLPASIHIAIDRHDGNGRYFAARIRALARFYEKHESLPLERRGGRRKGSCHLDDPDVHRAVHAWLEMQSVKDLTVESFRRALNTIILPELGN
ncbi:uncharacterized protein EI90DRAFT_3131107 [Cantharellus anzutake]|uniref:uncharacterized protein n=1 Tax=Cantharellus anzutake TaxID=1750568 RepID=UPI0019046DFA|nr:uncharacterized protein EI90DRAFT_3131107 [Cantharellus anzutake]KAF8322367.1 hypothetical protein EI90DRAFT_3131107 [Cantharellus anzutake]